MVKATPPHVRQDVLDENHFTPAWSKFFDLLGQRIGGSKNYTLGGLLTQNTTAVGNVGAGEDNLITYTLDSNTLVDNGDSIEIEVFGTLAANANNKTIKLYLGSTQLFSTGAVASNAKDWQINCTIIKTGSATQECIASFNGDTVLVTQTADYVSGAEDFTTQLTIKCTGEATADNDIIQKGLRIKFYPVR